MNAFALLATVLCCASLGQAVWLESPPVTNWGEWGEEEKCDPGSHVVAFRIKVQPNQGALDDTALNAIELHCTPKNETDGERHYIISNEGIKGSWGTSVECPLGSYAVGFEMKTEPVTLFDNTAANNLRLFCSNAEGVNDVIEGVGGGWGDWTGPLNCPRGMHITSLKVQVEDPVVEPPSKQRLSGERL